MVHRTVSVLPSAAALVLAVASACGNPQTGGTQTNWLHTCETDDDCGSGLLCRCGACTLTCEENGSSCAALPGAACVSASDVGVVALCGGSAPSSTGLCLLRCEGGECPTGTACVAGVCAPLREATDVVTVDTSVSHQTLVGFGAGVAWLIDEVAQHPANAALYDAMFAESGFHVVRLLNRYDESDTTDLTSSVEIMNAATERLGTRPTMLLSSSTPPAALKANGSRECGGDPDTCTLVQLADGNFDYAGFASHWRATLEAYAAAEIEPDYISIQNDPDWVPPESAPNSACRFLPTEGTATVSVNDTDVQVEYPGYSEALATVQDALSGLPSIPLIVAPETTRVDSTVSFASQLDLTNIDALAHHMYDIDPGAVDRDALLALHDLGETSELTILQTEMQAEGLETAILMHEALSTIGVSAYLQNDFVHSAFVQPPDPAALIALSETDFTIQDPYHAVRHFAHDTAPGWERVETSSEQGSVLATAWLSPDAESVTVVLVNPAATETTVEIALDDRQATISRVTRTVFSGSERSAELGALPPNNVVTLPGEAVLTVVVAAR